MNDPLLQAVVDALVTLVESFDGVQANKTFEGQTLRERAEGWAEHAVDQLAEEFVEGKDEDNDCDCSEDSHGNFNSKHCPIHGKDYDLSDNS